MDLAALATQALAIIRVAGPVVALLGLVVVLAQLGSAAGRARLTLAMQGLSAGDHRLVRRLLAGTLVPTLGVTALTVSLALEQEIRQGPNRMLERLQGAVPDEDLAWVLQRGTGHLMDTSELPERLVQAAEVSAVRPAPAYLPLWGELVMVDQQDGPADTGFVLGLPHGQTPSPLAPAVDTGSATCRVQEGRCVLRPGEAVVDAGMYPIGSRLLVREHSLRVVAHTREPYSLINRVVVFVDSALFRNEANRPEPAYGLLAAGPDALSAAQQLAEVSGVQSTVEVLHPATLRAENARFWAGNGTPLVLVMIALSATFCGVALYAARRAAQEREQVALGTLLALGLRPGQTSQVDLLRATVATFLAAAAAWPLALGVIHLTNSGMLGFHAVVTAGMPVAAAGVIVAANGLGTVVLWLRLRRRSITEVLAA